ncbi:MAG: hypothetical protein WDN76_09960 [Alphaproteobacteria bacterium]
MATEGSAKPLPLAAPPAPAFASAKGKLDRRFLIAGAAASAVAGGALIWSQREPAVPAQAQALYRDAIATFPNSDAAQRAQAVAFLREAVSIAPITPMHGQVWHWPTCSVFPSVPRRTMEGLQQAPRTPPTER